MSEEVTVSVGKTLGSSDLLSFGKDKALENSAFWICLMNLARTFRLLPIHAYLYFHKKLQYSTILNSPSF
jgi:hypothetical protein